MIVMIKLKMKQTNPGNSTSLGFSAKKITLMIEGSKPPIPVPLTQYPKYSGGNGLNKDEVQPWNRALKTLTNQ